MPNLCFYTALFFKNPHLRILDPPGSESARVPPHSHAFLQVGGEAGGGQLLAAVGAHALGLLLEGGHADHRTDVLAEHVLAARAHSVGPVRPPVRHVDRGKRAIFGRPAL